MLQAILRHGLSHKWVCASASYTDPTPSTYPEALLTCLFVGGEVVFVG